MKQNLINKPLFQATIGDVVQFLKEELGLQVESDNAERGTNSSASKKSKEFVYGIAGLSKLLSCSTATAQRIKTSGVIDAAISQAGKIIVIDSELALDLLRLGNKKWGRKYSR